MSTTFDLRRCIWSGRWTDEVVQVDLPWKLEAARDVVTVAVLPEHEADLRSYVERSKRYGPYLLAGVLGLCALMVVATALRLTWVSSVSVALLGVLFMALPFANPPTFQVAGIRQVMRFVRVVGAAMLVLGLVLLIRLG